MASDTYVFSAQAHLDALAGADLVRQYGKVRQVIGVVIESLGPNMAVGETCSISYKRSAEPVLAEVVGFRDSKVLIMPLGELMGIGAGSDVVAHGALGLVSSAHDLLGRGGERERLVDQRRELLAFVFAHRFRAPPSV